MLRVIWIAGAGLILVLISLALFSPNLSQQVTTEMGAITSAPVIASVPAPPTQQSTRVNVPAGGWETIDFVAGQTVRMSARQGYCVRPGLFPDAHGDLTRRMGGVNPYTQLIVSGDTITQGPQLRAALQARAASGLTTPLRLTEEPCR